MQVMSISITWQRVELILENKHHCYTGFFLPVIFHEPLLAHEPLEVLSSHGTRSEQS